LISAISLSSTAALPETKPANDGGNRAAAKQQLFQYPRNRRLRFTALFGRRANI
jgi:hypothetical protein